MKEALRISLKSDIGKVFKQGKVLFHMVANIGRSIEKNLSLLHFRILHLQLNVVTEWVKLSANSRK